MNWNVFEAPTTPAIFPKASAPSGSTYTLEAVQGEVVDIILINPSRMVHPQHLHGSGFWLLAAGNGDPLAADGKGLAPGVKLNVADPPVRDTVAVPQAVGDGPAGYGYSVLRFRADNPGPWAFRESPAGGGWGVGTRPLGPPCCVADGLA
jgi:FtsP/CotA-like multicopper oxidase with cupredoxin domain